MFTPKGMRTQSFKLHSGHQVMVTTSTLLGQTVPHMILIIPAFGIYVALVLAIRKVKLQTVTT